MTIRAQAKRLPAPSATRQILIPGVRSRREKAREQSPAGDASFC